jgi:hypothetical protein
MQDLKQNKTMLGIDFIFNKIKAKKNYAWIWFHFYTSLNQRKLCLNLVSFLHKIEPEKTMLEVGGFIFTQS